MKCPRDNSKLKSEVYEGDITVDICPSCEGMWLDKGELERIERIRQRDYSEELKRIPDLAGNAYKMARQKMLPEICCPKCGDKLSNHEYAYCSQIMIDVCPKCLGIWLDRDEIKALEIFFERVQMDTREIRKGFWASLSGLFRK